jgi:hypothetical protein
MCNNIRAVGSGVFCALRTEAIYRRPPVISSQSVRAESDSRAYKGVESLQEMSQLRAAAGSWGRGQLGSPEEGERPPLEEVTKPRSENRDWEH